MHLGRVITSPRCTVGRVNPSSSAFYQSKGRVDGSLDEPMVHTTTRIWNLTLCQKNPSCRKMSRKNLSVTAQSQASFLLLPIQVQGSVFRRIIALWGSGSLEWVVESTTVTHSSADWWDLLLPLA